MLSWLSVGLKVLLDKGQAFTWASFHAQKQLPRLDPAAIVALLQLFFEKGDKLFFEKTDTPAMIKHGMDVIKAITHFLNPGQIPVMGCDCPVFAKAKFIQWTWPDTHGENKFV